MTSSVSAYCTIYMFPSKDVLTSTLRRQVRLVDSSSTIENDKLCIYPICEIAGKVFANLSLSEGEWKDLCAKYLKELEDHTEAATIEKYLGKVLETLHSVGKNHANHTISEILKQRASEQQFDDLAEQGKYFIISGEANCLAGYLTDIRSVYPKKIRAFAVKHFFNIEDLDLSSSPETILEQQALSVKKLSSDDLTILFHKTLRKGYNTLLLGLIVNAPSFSWASLTRALFMKSLDKGMKNQREGTGRKLWEKIGEAFLRPYLDKECDSEITQLFDKTGADVFHEPFEIAIWLFHVAKDCPLKAPSSLVKAVKHLKLTDDEADYTYRVIFSLLVGIANKIDTASNEEEKSELMELGKEIAKKFLKPFLDSFSQHRLIQPNTYIHSVYSEKIRAFAVEHFFNIEDLDLSSSPETISERQALSVKKLSSDDLTILFYETLDKGYNIPLLDLIVNAPSFSWASLTRDLFMKSLDEGIKNTKREGMGRKFYEKIGEAFLRPYLDKECDSEITQLFDKTGADVFHEPFEIAIWLFHVTKDCPLKAPSSLVKAVKHLELTNDEADYTYRVIFSLLVGIANKIDTASNEEEKSELMELGKKIAKEFPEPFLDSFLQHRLIQPNIYRINQFLNPSTESKNL